MHDPRPADRFPTTSWGRVVRAGGDDPSTVRAALADLCRAYWYPLYALIRRRGHDPESSHDLTQSYFARLLDSDVLAAADRRKGRFRAFLKADCGHFLADQRDREHARKRGGGRPLLTIDARDAEGRYLVEPADNLTPERLFDRAWATALLDRTLEQLSADYAASGRSAWFDALHAALTDAPNALPYAAIAARLGATEAAVQQAASRLKKRYRARLRDQIAATLDEPTEAAIDSEVRDLFAALSP